MGVVYLARDPQLDREVALKVIRASRSGDTQARAKLAREARSMARISHPNVVHVYDAGVFDDEEGIPRVFIAMERVDGRDLREHMKVLQKTDEFKAGQLTEEITRLYIQAGRGLAVAHEAGLVHRDFKPANVFVSRTGEVMVGDFGLARPVNEDDARAMEEGVRASSLPDDASVTRGAVGTPGFMAPEIVVGEAVDERADQYAFCVSLYEALYAEKPIRGETMAALVLATLENVIQPAPERPKVDARLREVIVRGLAKAPDDRWASMPELLEALEGALDRVPARRRLIAAIAAVSAVGAIAYGVGSARGPMEDPCADAGADSMSWASGRGEIEEAFDATGAEYAQQAWQATERRLGAYSEALRAEYRAACEATAQGTQSESLLDRRVQCLESRRLELEAFATELQRADVGVVDEAPVAAGALPSLDPCRSPSLADAAMPDATDADVVSDLSTRLASFRGRVRAGQLESLIAPVRALTDEADAVEFSPIQAQAWLLRASVERRLGQYADAHEHLRDAFRLATAAGEDELALTAATSLIDLASVELGRAEEGGAWSDVATGVLGRVGDRDDLAIELGTRRARMQNALGHRDVALELAREALSRAEGLHGEEALELAPILATIGDTQGKLRDYLSSAETARRAIAVLQPLGENHPEVIAANVRLAAALAGAGRADEAIELIEDAVRRARSSLPANHPILAKAMTRHGDVLSMTGHAADALPIYAQALEVTRTVYDEPHTEVGRVILNMAGAMAREGLVDDAIASWREVLLMREALLGEEHPDLVIVLQNMGSVMVERGEAEDALPYLERARRIRFATPASEQARADVEYWLGRALYESGRDPAGGRARVVAARDASLEGGYTNPATTMSEWLDANPVR